jgi:cob(I)alamin adenosyltransferase
MLEKGYIQVYTGNGKGKTTAALGITLRTICAGNKVFFGQFMKGQDYSELKACQLLPGLTMEQFGGVCFINGKPTDQDIEDAHKGLDKMRTVLASGEYDMVVFDEINTSLFFHLVSVEEVLAALDLKPERTEVILTGRYAPQEIMDRADLVTEMKEIKHYYNAGIDSRVGIEN